MSKKKTAPSALPPLIRPIKPLYQIIQWLGLTLWPMSFVFQLQNEINVKKLCKRFTIKRLFMRSMMIIRFDFDIRFNGIAFRINKSFFFKCRNLFLRIWNVNKKKFQSIKTFSQNYDYTVIFLSRKTKCTNLFFLKFNGPFFERTWVTFTQGCFVPSFSWN